MRDHEMERKIRTAIEHAAPDMLEQIISSCESEYATSKTPMTTPDGCEQMKGAVITMTTRTKNRFTSFAAVAAAAAVLFLCFGIYALLQQNTEPKSEQDTKTNLQASEQTTEPTDTKQTFVVTLDVNPSLSLHVDETERVQKTEALNAEAQEILGTMDLTDTTLEVAVNAIIGSMLQKGYLDDLHNAILVSVDNSANEKSRDIQEKVSKIIADAMKGDDDNAVDAAVLSQTVDAEDTELAALAEQYGISLGKAALIMELVEMDPNLTEEALAPMSIHEISLIAASRHLPSDTLTQTGTASEKAYISRDDALTAVLDHLGAARDDLADLEIEFDSEDGMMVYELEFWIGATEYEFDVNAVSGEIVKYVFFGDAEIDPEQQSTLNHYEQRDYIGEDAALQAALDHAGVSEASLTERQVSFDVDDGRAIYEIEFAVGPTEYEFEIDAVTGTILQYEKELDD